jgi:hypothetical protein
MTHTMSRAGKDADELPAALMEAKLITITIVV